MTTADVVLPGYPPVADDADAAVAQRDRRRRLLRMPLADEPRRVRLSLAGLLVGTAVLYLISLSRNGDANAFYAAAVQAGSVSWKAWFFGSFDAHSFITVDKPPASLWVMGLSTRIFGYSSWSLLVPQALEGVAAVALLFAAVRRWAGPAAGLVAGAVLALTPVATLMFRFDNPDALLVLLLTLAAYFTVRAVDDGRTRWLLYAGVAVGFAFLTKQLQAFLVVPGLGLTYLVAGPTRLRRRLWQLGAALGAIVVGGGWWVAVVELTPAADRPYVGGSTNNSFWDLTFGYNGIGRLSGNETGSVGFGNGRGPAFGGGASARRLFGAEMGGQASWLIPAALVALLALLVVRWRSPRTDKIRAAALLWGGWLLVTGIVLSYAKGIIHPYYTIALAPGIGGLVGVGAVGAWRARSRWSGRLVMAAMAAATTWWAFVLLDRTPSWHPWLRWLILVAGILAGVGALVPVLQRIPSGARRALTLGTVTGGLVAGLAGPAAYSFATASTRATGSIPSAGPSVPGGGGFGGGGAPGGRTGGRRFGGQLGGAPGGGFGQFGGRPGGGGFPGGGQQGAPPAPGAAPGGGTAPAGRVPGGFGGRGGGGLGGDTTVDPALTSLLKSGAAGYTWAAAVTGATSAAPLQLASREPIMAIGGFNGTDPTPTLAAFEKLVAQHKVHYYVVGTGFGAGGRGGGGSQPSTQIASWVAATYTSTTVGGDTVYDLSTAK